MRKKLLIRPLVLAGDDDAVVPARRRSPRTRCRSALGPHPAQPALRDAAGAADEVDFVGHDGQVFVGTVEADEGIMISAQVPGKVKRITFQSGAARSNVGVGDRHRIDESMCVVVPWP